MALKARAVPKIPKVNSPGLTRKQVSSKLGVPGVPGVRPFKPGETAVSPGGKKLRARPRRGF